MRVALPRRQHFAEPPCAKEGQVCQELKGTVCLEEAQRDEAPEGEWVGVFQGK